MSDVTAEPDAGKPRPGVEAMVASQVKRYVRFIKAKRVPVRDDDVASEAWCAALVAVRRPSFCQEAEGAAGYIFNAIKWGVGPQIASWLSPASLTKREAEEGTKVASVEVTHGDAAHSWASPEDLVAARELVARLHVLRCEYTSERKKRKGARRPGRMGILVGMIKEIEREMS